MPNNKFTHIDCFSGVGGICTGFHAANFNTILAIEKVKSCVDTYRTNHPETHVINSDICKVTEGDIRKIVPKKQSVDIVTSGMPCETFSTAGATSRSFYDDRQYLFMEGIRIAKITQAKMILFENVPAITTKRIKKNSKKLIIDEIFSALDKAGYTNHISVTLNSSDFGVPQYRDRYFILASRFDWELTYPVNNQKPVSVREAFIDLPKSNTKAEVYKYKNVNSSYSLLMKDFAFWESSLSEKVTYHLSPNHREKTIKRFEMIKQGEGLKDLFDKLTPDDIEKYQKEKILPKKWYIQRNRRLLLDSPSPTVTSHCLDELLHPIYNRAITVREAARLQSFPDSYDFLGGQYVCPHNAVEQDKYEQIGDAVPPLLAYAWAVKISEILRSNFDE